MTGDDYIRSVLSRHSVASGSGSPPEMAARVASTPIQLWAGTQLNSLSLSGSYAKGTAVSGTSDIDLFVSLKAATIGTLRDIYNSLFELAQLQGWNPRRQNVSIGTTIRGSRVDLVPARVHAGSKDYHSLYVSKRDSWTQTNVALHLSTVRLSSRQREIRALKIWRKLNGLDIPSLHLELFIIDALFGMSHTALATNVFTALQALASSFASTRIVDPGNASNVISDDMTQSERLAVERAASVAANQGRWESIIW